MLASKSHSIAWKKLIRLHARIRLCQLQKKLSRLYNSSINDSDDIAAWIADILGLSNRSLSATTPMQSLNAHGASLHLSKDGAIVIVKCSHCDTNFLIRMALFKPASRLLGVKAYRIPGLKYESALTGRSRFSSSGWTYCRTLHLGCSHMRVSQNWRDRSSLSWFTLTAIKIPTSMEFRLRPNGFHPLSEIESGRKLPV